MNEDFFDRLDKYIKYKGLNDNKVTVQAGIPVGSLGKQRKGSRGLSVQSIAKLLYTYSDLNAEWLLTGNGSMIKNKNNVEIGKDYDNNIRPLTELLSQMHFEVKDLTSQLQMQISQNEKLMREIELLRKEKNIDNDNYLEKKEKKKEKERGKPPINLPRRVYSNDTHIATEEYK